MAATEIGSSIIVIGLHFEVSGTVPTRPRERVSDHLNEQRSALILTDCEIESAPGFVTRAADIAITRSEILLAIPVHEEPLPEDNMAALSIPKARQRARLLVGDWVVEGNLHIGTDGNVERFLNYGATEFLPVTDCTLTGGGRERRLPLILVSRTHLALIAGAPDDRAAPAPD